MTGPGHYLAAERLVEVAKDAELGSDNEDHSLKAAQVHATLALAYAHNRTTTELIGLMQALLTRIEPEWDSEDSNAYVAAEEARESGGAA